MTRVLVVSRNAALGMWLSRHGLDVDEVSPSDDVSWPAQVSGYTALLLDVGDVERAERRLRALVKAGLSVPVALVGDGGPGWDVLAARFRSGLSLLRLPIQPEAVLAEITRLSNGHCLNIVGGPLEAPQRTTGSIASEAPEAVDVPLLGLAGSVEATPLFDALKERADTLSPATLDPSTSQQATQWPTAKAPAAHTSAAESPAPDLLRPPPAVKTDAATTRTTDVAGISLLDLVAALQRKVAGLHTVHDVAELALIDVLGASGASAGAALMRSDQAWVVEAGLGLRPLEERLEVPETHWLIRHVVRDGLGLLVARSEGAGSELVGVPLASWEHLSAVFLPDSGLLILLASAERPFEEHHLTAVRGVDEELAELILQATAVRELARSLVPFIGSDLSNYST